VGKTIACPEFDNEINMEGLTWISYRYRQSLMKQKPSVRHWIAAT
jgi:hypothetical protein